MNDEEKDANDHRRPLDCSAAAAEPLPLDCSAAWLPLVLAFPENEEKIPPSLSEKEEKIDPGPSPIFPRKKDPCRLGEGDAAWFACFGVVGF